MGILSGLEIRKHIGKEIQISDFDPKRLNPNSYNLRLADELLVYDTDALDMKQDNPHHTFKITDEGFVMQPGKLYLGRTMERTITDKYVPMLEGRSSVGRLGITIHVTAGFGDVGFNGFWTLELSCVQPVRIYPGVEIGQIYYHTIEGEYEKYTRGKYQGNNGIQASRLWRDFIS